MSKSEILEREVQAQPEFSERAVFLEEFKEFIGRLCEIDKRLEEGSVEDKYAVSAALRQSVENVEEKLPLFEVDIFKKATKLFSLKHSLPPLDLVPEASAFFKAKGKQDLSVQMAGPLAVGKSTLARFLGPEIGARTERERFVPSENPFLSESYKNPDLMLKTQLNFLLGNVIAGVRGKYYKGRWVQDTSVWSDVFIFMQWRKKKSIVNEDEHEAYLKLFEIMKPLIDKPDLMLVFQPTSIDDLWAGLQERLINESDEREMERAVTQEDLEVVAQAAIEAAETFRNLGIDVMEVVVDPRKIYSETELRYSIVYEIRKKLGILGEYLSKTPREASQQAVEILTSANGKSQLIFFHSKSMFTGKTEAIVNLKKLLGESNSLAFQPGVAARPGLNEGGRIVSRDGNESSAMTISSNRLSDILRYMEKKGITPSEVSHIFIDEVMLFIGEDNKNSLEALDRLLKIGFNVVVNGVDYTFKEEPFTFTHKLLEKTTLDSNWHEIEMSTKCKYCEEAARGTRRVLKNGKIASYTNDNLKPGDEEYEPVCCQNGHVSCVNQPLGFKRQPLPTEERMIYTAN